MNKAPNNLSGLGGLLIKALPYFTISTFMWWALDRRNYAFWFTFGALLCLRGLFAVAEYYADYFEWSLTDKRRLHFEFTTLLRNNDFPDPSKLMHCGFLDYLRNMDRHTTNESTRAAARKALSEIHLATLNISRREERRYEAIMSEAFQDWFVETWRHPASSER
jgi:hypothetical protein